MTKNIKKYTITSLFCGLGGLDLGFIWEDYSVIWANDSSQYAVNTYMANIGREAICADIVNYPNSEIPVADVIIGGPPCQSFSLVGQRKKDDERGKLVFRFLEIIKSKMPLAFVMENVPGMEASMINGQRLPEVLVKSFSELGYSVLKVKLIASDYLVPQLRKRLFLIGCLGAMPEVPNAKIFARECYDIDIEHYEISAKAAIGDLGPCSTKGERAKYRKTKPSQFAVIMREKKLPDVSLHEMPKMSETDKIFVQHIPPGGNYKDIPDAHATGRVIRFKKSGGRTTTYGRLHPDKPSHTINTYFRRPNVGSNFHYSEPRLITPREAMRFQSIPDHFELSYSSQDQRNALIGNAVPPLLARAVAWSLKKTLSKLKR